MSAACPATVPVSTYRLQFNPTFRFVDAERIVPYLADLGIGHLYASPYFRARPGSTHGYDVVDHNMLNPEIGSDAEHRSMIAAAQGRDLGHLLDFVPNHMGIGFENPWWRDVLEWGVLSTYANFFDIDWNAQPGSLGRVVVPALGDHYGAVIERCELKVVYVADSGTFELHYYDHRFPLAPRSYGDVLTIAADTLDGDAATTLRAIGAEFAALRTPARDDEKRAALHARADDLKGRLAAFARDGAVHAAIDGATAAMCDPDRMDALVEAQAYRLAYWRVAADEINYRRFFDVNDLAGLRIEDSEVLARTHELVFAMIDDGRIQGLRIDHVDGLYNPGGYCNLLRDRTAALEQPLYLVVEKILGAGETLRPTWRIDGTTGYEYMNLVNGLFVDPQAERAFDRIYRRVVGRDTRFSDEAYEAKKRVMGADLSSELSVLANILVRIARSDRRSNDLTLNRLRDALLETIAAFPVYRTYVTDEDPDAADVAVIRAAVDAAEARSIIPDDYLFRFVREALTAHLAAVPDAKYDRTAVLRFALRFQQYTGPVTAKSIEDTAFYRYVRLVSLNEVGGEPSHFGVSVEEFHRANDERARTHPHNMLATATHDHKRGEDTRLRIDALSEFPSEWSRAIARWTRMNAGAFKPQPSDEFLFYQSVVGTLPHDWLAGDAPVADDELAAYADRLAEYATKAAREAKLRTSWTNPNADYETQLTDFVRGALGAQTPFFRDARAFVALLAPVAAVGSLAQVALKLTSPGVPDIYQGCELWDLSLVDPDNRRPVDYNLRASQLAALHDAAGDPVTLLGELLEHWHDGRIKLYLTWQLLQLRRAHRDTMIGSAYRPLATDGNHAGSLVAFERDEIVTIVPRLVRGLLAPPLGVAFTAERVLLGRPNATYRNVLDGTTVSTDGDGALRAAAVFAHTPVAVLVRA